MVGVDVPQKIGKRKSSTSSGQSILQSDFENPRSRVADLAVSQIEQMNDGELIEVIRSADVPWHGATFTDRLPFYDRSTLLRLAFLARRCCRNLGY